MILQNIFGIQEFKDSWTNALTSFNDSMISLDMTGTKMFKNLVISSKNFISTLWSGLTVLQKTSVIIAAVSAAIMIIDSLVDSLEDVKEAAEGFSSSISEFNSSIKENKSTLSELNDRYKELSKGVGELGQNLSLTDSEYDEYKNIISQVSDIMPGLTAKYNEQGEKIGFVKNQLVDLNKEYEKYQQNQSIKFIVDGDEEGNTFQDVLDDYRNVNQGKIGSGGTSFWNILKGSILETVSIGSVDTTEDIYTSKFISNVLKTALDQNNKENVIQVLRNGLLTQMIDADEEKQIFGASISEIKDMSEEEFNIWRDNLNGYISKYESEIENANNRIREGLFTLAKSKDDYWDQDFSDDEKNMFSSFVSNMTDDMIAVFENEDGTISQGKLDSFILKLISNFSTNEEFSNAFSSLMSESFKNMPYDEAIDAILEWLNTIAEVTGMDSYLIQKMFGLENFGIDVNKAKKGIKTDKKGNVTDEYGETVSVSEALQSLDYEDAQIAENIIGKLKDGEKISWKKLLEQIEATKKALKDTDVELTIVSSVKTIAEQLEPQFKELAEAYQKIFTKDGFTLKNVDNSMLEGLRSSFAEIEKDLGVDFDSSELEGFFAVLSDGSSTAEEVQQSFNDLATSYLNSTDVLENLNDETKISVIKQLEQLGITNANTVVTEALEKAKAKEHVQTKKNINVTSENIDSLIDEANTAGITTNAYLEMTAKEILFNNNKIDTSSKCEQILEIAKAAGVASTTLSALNTEIADVAGKKIGSGARTSYAKSKGVEVISEKNRTDGKKNGNLYVVGGKEFDDFTEAMQYAEAYNTMQNISSAFNTKISFDGNSGTLGDNGGSEDSKETFDWIETKLSRIQRVITNLGKTVSATYKTWGKRNSELVKQISEVNNEIATQQQGYDYYMAKANSVGLPSGYQELVKNGGIRIDEISDETTKEKIQEFQEWYEKALACEDAIQDLNDELANLARTKFDNISKQFENEMSGIEHELSMLEGYVDQTEARGSFVSKSYYSSMMDLENKNIAILQNEYASLNTALQQALDDKQIELYSEEWYNMCGEINAVQKEILDANTSLIELQNTMRELDWEVFNKTQEFISQVTGEGDWLIGLMSDEKMYDENTGLITDQGQATLGLHAVNFNTYMSQADDYAEELRKINAEIAEDPNNLTLLEHRQELLEAQRDMISAAEDEKQAMKDLVSDGYDAFLNAMQEMIDKRKEAMQQIKDLHDYEKNISDLSKEVTVLEKQELAMRGDDSEEGQAKWQQIQTSLQEARENLEETEYEKYLSDQEQMLDNLMSETEEWINGRLDDIDGLISGVIDETNQSAATIKETLELETSKVGATLSEEMNNIWSNGGAASNIVSMYGDNFNSYATTTVNTLLGIKAGIDAMLAAQDIKANTNINSVSYTNAINSSASSNSSGTDSSNSSGDSGNSGSSSRTGWGSWFINKVDSYPKAKLRIDTSVVDRLKYWNFDSSMSARSKYYSAMGGTGTYSGSSQQNRWILEQMKANGFAKGGTIGGLINKSGEDGFVLARTGEEILSLEKIEGIRDVFESMNPIVKMLSSMPVYTHYNGMGGNIITNDIEMNIVLEGIHNSDEFITELKTNKKFEKFVQQITVGNALGRNTLSKNRYY